MRLQEQVLMMQQQVLVAIRQFVVPQTQSGAGTINRLVIEGD